MTADPSYTVTDTPVQTQLSGRLAREAASEYENFKDLAGKLLRVPKHEIDAEQAKEDERKEADRREERHSLPVSPA